MASVFRYLSAVQASNSGTQGGYKSLRQGTMSSLPMHSFPASSGGMAQLPLSQPPLPTNSAVTPISPAIDDGDDQSSDNGLPPEPKSATRWFFSNESLEDTPSRRCGMDREKEAELRMQAATYIQDIGTKLQVNQLCINTAMVYMHRFYMYHSFTLFPNNSISVAAIFLAAKVEEQPRKLDYVIKVAHYSLFRDTPNPPPLDPKSEAFALQASELVSNENIMLQTLGFDVSVDHPHTHVVKCCQLVRASKDLAQTSYFMATNSLHLTTMCLKYQPSVVACVCIHLSCKWSNWEIPRSKEGKEWYYYVDSTVTSEQLDELTVEFLTTFNQTPARLKKKVMTLSAATSGGAGGSGGALTNFPTHFYLDKNSAGVQTIKPRSRSPSPGSSKSRPPSGSGGQKPPIAASNKPQRLAQPPVLPGQPHHPGSKPNPGPYPGMDKRPHGLPPKPQFPHLQPQGHSHSAQHPGYGPKDGSLPMKPYSTQHPLPNGVHGSYHGNRPPQHPSQHHSAPVTGGHSHPAPHPGAHGHATAKPAAGSQLPPNNFASKPSQQRQQIPPPNHDYRSHGMPQAGKTQGPPLQVSTGNQPPPPANSGMPHKEGPYVRPGSQSTGYPSSNGTHGQYPSYGTRPLHPHAPTHPAHPLVGGGPSTQAPQPLLPAPKPLMASHVHPPESLKRRQPELGMPAPGGRPIPNMPQLKRPRQEGVNPSNLSSLAPSAEEVLKQEPLMAAQQQKKPTFFNSFKSEVKLEAPEVPPAAPAPLMPIHSFNTFPLLSSEIAGTPNANFRAEPPAAVIPPVKPALQAFPQLTNSINASAGKLAPPVPTNPPVALSAVALTPSSDHSSSSKKKKKKKDHKHKKEDKEHKHKDRKDKEEKKHKKDKHRDKDGEKHKSSKDKHHRHSTNHEVEATHGKESNKIRIKAVPKDTKESSKHSSKKNQQQLPQSLSATIYY